MIKIVYYTFILTISSIIAVPLPHDSITQASGSGSINGSSNGGAVTINQSFGSVSTSDGKTANYGTTSGLAKGPNSSFGSNIGTSAAAINPNFNSFSNANSAMNGATGPSSGMVNLGSTFGTGSVNGVNYITPGPGTSFGTGATSGTTSGDGAFGANTNFQTSQNNALSSSHINGQGTSFGSSTGPYSGTYAGNNINIISNNAGTIATSDNSGSSTGTGFVGAGTNFNGAANNTPLH